MKNAQVSVPAPFLRRLGALLYDSLVLISILMVATALLLITTHGQAIAPNNPFFRSYLVLISFFFLAGFWVFSGQTIGMRAWRLTVISSLPTHSHSLRITWWQALLRFILAPPLIALGIGWLWVLFDSKKRTLYENWSGTQLVFSPVKPI